MDVKKISRLSMLLALSIVLSIIESLIPISNMVYGLKLGLANTVIVFVIYMYSFKEAFTVSLLRVLLVGLLRTGLFNYSFFFSLGGALLSIVLMMLAKKFTNLGVVSISVIGAIAHNLGQIIVGVFLLKSFSIVLYFPYLLIFAIISGIIIGAIMQSVLKFYQKS